MHILTKTELAPDFTVNIHYSDLSNEENLMKCKFFWKRKVLGVLSVNMQFTNSK